MALNGNSSATSALYGVWRDRSVAAIGSNDAFSFWKLPENWRSALARSIPQSAAIAERFLFQKYLEDEPEPNRAQRETYHRFRNLVPGLMRHRRGARAAGASLPRDFPNWPCESALLDYWRQWLRGALKALHMKDGWHIGFWPAGARCSIVLMHDIESREGFMRIEGVAKLEEKYGFRSAWNLALARTQVDWHDVNALSARGFEFGTFSRKPPGQTAVGDRGSGADEFAFDSSLADTEPHQVHPGGTCSVFPFFLPDSVELPYTLESDRTFVRILHRSPLPIWTLKARWIATVGGMILVRTDPGCIGAENYLPVYEKLLDHLNRIDGAWRVLPSEAAAWWRRRDALTLEVNARQPIIAGSDTAGAVAQRLLDEPLVQ